MKHVIQCFVLFSAVVIVACVVALLLPGPNAMATAMAIEGFQNATNMTHAPVSAAGQSSLSSTAGSADGSSDHQHLLDKLLKKQDRLAEAFENRPSGSVTATTTQKGGIASISADANANPSGLAGCSDKCVKIENPANAVRGACVNPPISATNRNPDYSKKYCMAFRTPDQSMNEQECMTCGYYTYTAECLKKADPKNPDRCTKYGDYAYQVPTGANAKPYYECSNSNPVCNLFLEKGGGGGGGSGTPDKSGPDCSAATCPAKEVTIAGVTTSTKKCVVPGCLSNNGGLPYPKNFYGNDMINPCKPNPNGNGYICPAVTFGSTTSYNSVGGSDDPCYTTNGKIDISKFQSMNQMPVCNSVKPTSVQNFNPGTTNTSSSSRRGTSTSTGTSRAGAGTSTSTGTSRAGAGTSTGTRTSTSTGTTGTVVNVYHHYVSEKPRWSNTYKQPDSGLIYLGIY